MQLRTAILFSYFISIILTPWFHQHPDEDHHELNGNIFHSHTEPFDSHPSEHDDDERHEKSIKHQFAKMHLPLYNIPGFTQTNFYNIFNPIKSVPKLDLLNPPSIDISQNQIYKRNTFKTRIPQTQRDYYALFATNLSPPQA